MFITKDIKKYVKSNLILKKEKFSELVERKEENAFSLDKIINKFQNEEFAKKDYDKSFSISKLFSSVEEIDYY